MFILATLAVLGGDSLTDFAIALLLGLGDRHPVDDLHRVGAGGRARGAVAVRPVGPEARTVDPYAHIQDRPSDGAVV